MLSARMAKVLREVPYHDLLATFRDGRTVHALRSRGLITKVEWNQGQNTYTFKLTKRGMQVAKQLRYIDKTLLNEEILS